MMVMDDLDHLAKSVMIYDKAEIYNALVKLMSDYLNELNKGK